MAEKKKSGTKKTSAESGKSTKACKKTLSDGAKASKSAHLEDIDKLTYLCDRGQELSSIEDLGVLLEQILKTATEITSSTASSILLLDRASDELYFRSATGKNAEQITKIRFKADKGVAGWVIKNRKPAVVNDASRDTRHFSFVDESLSFKTKNLVCVPIMWENEVTGVLEVLNKKGRSSYTDLDLEYLTILANQAGSSIYITAMVDKLQNFFINMLEILMMASETLAANPGHHVRVARLATKIAREMGVPEEDYNNIYYASLIHDIGLIKVAREQIVGGEKLIPKLGAEMIRPIKILKKLAALIEAHHERWDGSGQPNGLAGTDIPLGARIIALAEEFEEFKEEEAYRKKFDPEYSDDFFKRITVTHDPEVVEAFKKVRRQEQKTRT